MKTFPYLPLLSVILLISACSISKKTSQNSSSLDNLVQLMTGTFDSSAQEAQDSSYYNISLQMYPIWTKKEGNWLYVEQAMAAMPDKPYRQRIYKVEQVDKMTFVSKIYSLANREDCVGKWASPNFFDQFGKEILKEREGCGVYLNMKSPQHFEGSTQDKDCKSSLRGASYATSKVAVYKDKIISWDQGFDEKDEQVWGAEKGGYIFVKK